MRLLFGDGVRGESPLEALLDTAPRGDRPDRPWVSGNMVASVDGATAIAGESRGLSGPTDRVVFHRLRAQADAVMAGAGTVRADRYGPARPDDEMRARRERTGLAPVPPIVVVSRSLRLDWTAPLFTEPAVPTWVLCPEDAEPTALARARSCATVVAHGRGGVDLAAGLSALRGAGVRTLLCEGGPALLAQLAAAGALDELFLTVSPLLVSGDASRALRGPEIVPPARLRPAAAVLDDDGVLFLRYLAA